MEIVAVVIALALLEFVVFGMLVGRARGRYGVNAPAMSGHEVFDRYFRVHYNTMEMLVIFVPSIWLFGLYVSPQWGAAHRRDLPRRPDRLPAWLRRRPRKREIGFGLSVLPILVLLIGALWVRRVMLDR